ncbi:hypothetical protein [Xanthomonas nasturtii]|uniref:hypothetical protein n=1 Tax=Xanthomonas nasturtii TaxID=1843581 RepID=UPI002011BA2B|nr:hypothetical protein [Xanthomonas nasturtii]MCL1574873.1 hypothetical protein [Xanthomonas nasturtii]MCL1586493.1 hypothetical protein [Xanthomonas nasturtii]
MLKQVDRGLKAALLMAAFVGAGWCLHLAMHGGYAGQARDEQASRLEQSRAAVLASSGNFDNFMTSERSDMAESRKLGEARPRNDRACDTLTMDTPPWKMRMLGCLLGGEYPPAILERGERVRLDEALRDAKRSPTIAGEVADHPRDEAFCSKATTGTPRVETWRHGCLLWGDDPRITRYPVVLLDDALKRAGLQLTKAGPVPDQMPRNATYCDKARNTDNPLQLWRNGCLRRGQFPPFVDPEVTIDAALRESEARG